MTEPRRLDETFDPTAYGRATSADYDDLYAELDSTAAVDLLAALADGGPVLGLGIGTGRLALPLVARGLEVHGVEGSPEMVSALRRKPGGQDIPVVVGDFAEVSAGTGFSLAVLAINTVFALPSQDAQVRCFRNVGRHLRQGGRFVVEAWVPDVGAFRNGTAVRPVTVHEGRVELEVARLQPASQTMWTTKVHLTDQGVRLVPANHRYAWPAEMDLMARLAGLRLSARWSSWDKADFTDHSIAHISVWEKIADEAW
jgi:SAM-dependent methyltransferase